MTYKALISAIVLSCSAAMAGDIVEVRSDIEDSAKRNGVDPVLVEAIIRHESANGTSNAARKYNNLGGIMKGKKLKRFKTQQDSIESVAYIIAKYQERGLTSLDEIARRYAPYHRKEWVSCVRHFQNKIENGKI